MTCLSLEKTLNKAEHELYFKRFELMETQYKMVIGNDTIIKSLIPTYQTQQKDFVALEKKIRGLKNLIMSSELYMQQIELIRQLEILYEMSSNKNDIQELANQAQTQMENLLSDCVMSLKNIDQSDICDVPCRKKPLKKGASREETEEIEETEETEENTLEEMTSEQPTSTQPILTQPTSTQQTLTQPTFTEALNKTDEVPITGGGVTQIDANNARLEIVAKNFGLDPQKYDKKALCQELALKLMMN